MARPKKNVTFWDRVYSHTIFTFSCHIFNGHLDECGYGRIRKDGKLVRVHRAVWEDENGIIPDSMVICHTCDNPACINPKHLFIGTQDDNVKDMWKKGREKLLYGSENSSAKLNENDIPIIRKRIRAGEPCYTIAKDYNVTGESILAIKHKKTWKFA